MSLSPKHCAKGLHGQRHLPAGFDHFLESGGGGLVPLPGILECPNLRGRAAAVLLGEQDVVVLIAT